MRKASVAGQALPDSALVGPLQHYRALAVQTPTALRTGRGVTAKVQPLTRRKWPSKAVLRRTTTKRVVSTTTEFRLFPSPRLLPSSTLHHKQTPHSLSTSQHERPRKSLRRQPTLRSKSGLQYRSVIAESADERDFATLESVRRRCCVASSQIPPNNSHEFWRAMQCKALLLFAI